MHHPTPAEIQYHVQLVTWGMIGLLIAITTLSNLLLVDSQRRRLRIEALRRQAMLAIIQRLIVEQCEQRRRHRRALEQLRTAGGA